MIKGGKGRGRRGVNTGSYTPPSPSAPVNSGLPTISGSANEGQVLTASPGAWSGFPPPTFAYQWKRGATNVGTNSPTYTLVSADVGSTITVTVTATNTSGSASATSAATGTVTSTPTAPSISAVTISKTSPSVGDTLSVTISASGNPAPTYTYVWKADGATVGTAATYTVQSGDTGKAITCTVTASNGVGSSASLTSAATSPVVNEPPIVETSWLYEESFTYPDNTQLIAAAPGGPGFTAISGAGAVTTEKSNPKVVGGITAQSSVDFTSPGKYFLEAPVALPSANCIIQMKQAGTPGPDRGISLAAVDERSRIHLDLQTTVAVRKFDVSSGTAATSVNSSIGVATARYKGGGSANWKQAAVGDIWTVRYFNGKVFVNINGARVGMNAATAPNGGSDVSGAPAPTGTKVGFSTYNSEHVGWDDLKVAPLTGIMTINAPLKVYPRVQGLGGYANGAADITFSGTYEGVAPTGLQWALIEPESCAILKDWSRVASPTISGGNWSATVRVPCGLNGRKGYRIRFRAENDTFNEVESFDRAGVFFVAYTLLCVGQSNSAGIINTVPTNTILDHPGGFQCKPANIPPSLTPGTRQVTSSWELGTTESASFDNQGGVLTDILSQALNLPVYLSVIAQGGRSAIQCGPNGTEWTFLSTHLSLQGGAFDAIYKSQGEDEINSVSSTPANNWKGLWRDVNFPAYLALSGQPPGTTIPIFYAITGRVLDAATVPLSQRDANAAIVRKAQFELKDEVPNCYLAHHYLGCQMADNFHYVNDTNGQARANRRIGWTIANKVVGGASYPYDARGPLAGTPSRAGAVVTIPVTLNGAASLTALSAMDGSTAGDVNALTGWEVAAASDFAAPLTISSAVISGNNVVLTLAADPGGPVWVRSAAGNVPTITSWVHGSYTSGPANGQTIAMEPVVKPIQTAS